MCARFRPSPSGLERLRPYLEILARAGLGQKLRRRVGPSDVVQETLIEACRDLADFRGSGDDALLAWVRCILAHNVANVVRDQHRGRRDVALDRSIDEVLMRSSVALAGFAAKGPSPSDHAQRIETCISVSQALLSLPDDDREAVILHYVEGRTLAEIATELGKTRYAITRILRTSLRSMRCELEADS